MAAVAVHESDWRSFLWRAFVKPFTSGRLGLVYASGVLSQLGSVLASIFIVVDMAHEGLWAMAAFLFTRYLVTAVGFSGLAWVAPYLSRAILWIMVLTTSVLAVTAAMIWAHSPIVIGVALSVAIVPFWFAFHTIMLASTHDEDRGEEVSMAWVSNVLGGMFGAILAGVFLASGVERSDAAGLGFAFNGLGALCLLPLLPNLHVLHQKTSAALREGEQDVLHNESLWRALHRPRRYVFSTLATSMSEALTAFLLPVWLKMAGVAGLAIGLAFALKASVRFVLSPLTGILVRRAKGQELSLSAICSGLGWLGWLILSPSAALLTGTTLLWTAGEHLYGVGMDSRWYATRSYACLVVREIYLTVGRCLVTLIALPIIYGTPDHFPLIGIAIASILYACSFGWNPKLHMAKESSPTTLVKETAPKSLLTGSRV